MTPFTPKAMGKFHLLMVFVWLVMIPIAIFTALASSVPFLVMISLLALVFSELGAWQASLTERRLDDTDSYGDE